MKLLSILVIVTAAALLVAVRGTEVGSSAQEDPVEHGRYIVHQVSMCVQCHSPRDGQGKVREDRFLHGGQIPFKTPWGDRWAELAPNISNLAGYTDEEAMDLLTKGHKRNGKALRGPMPPFRLNSSDARAVIAYLRSL